MSGAGLSPKLRESDPVLVALASAKRNPAPIRKSGEHEDDAVRGGALLTGLGGDEFLAGHPNYALAASLLGRRRPSRRLMGDLVKRYVLRKRRRNQTRTELADNFPWLVPDARREVIERLVEVQLTGFPFG